MEIQMLAENVIKIEDMKHEIEPPERTWNTTEVRESSLMQRMVKEEDSEEEVLEPPVAVFLEPKEIVKEEVQEDEDPLMMCREEFSDVPLKKEEISGSPGGECASAEERNHRFSICQKSFVQRQTLAEHLQSHIGEKPYHCSVCQKVFPRKLSLAEHMEIHTGKHPCSLCQKSFAKRQNLYRHLRCHMGEKPHSCSLCQKRFSKSENLTRHMRTHTGERYYCSICLESYAEKRSLVWHMQTHTGEMS